MVSSSRIERRAALDGKSSVKENISDDTDESEDSRSDVDTDESESSTDWSIGRKPTKGAKKGPVKSLKQRKETPLPSKASICTLAHNPDDIIQSTAADASHVDQGVIARIVKALNLANHPGTGEQEAKAALRMAQKLMSQHSVTQAAVLATVEDKKERLQQAGMSSVSIRNPAGKRLFMSTWSQRLSCSMDTFFDCKSYTTSYTKKDRIDFVFYGLAEQTVAAAFAFEMVYNLIVTWSRDNKNAKGVHQKNAYCHGVADGLHRFAREEKQREENEAKAKEQRLLEAKKAEEEVERKRQIDRLVGQPPETSSDLKIEVVEEAKPSNLSKSKKPDFRPKVETVDDGELLKSASNSQSTVKTEDESLSHSSFLSNASSVTAVNSSSSLFDLGYGGVPDFLGNGDAFGDQSDSDDSSDEEDVLRPDFHDSDVDADLFPTEEEKEVIAPQADSNTHPIPPPAETIVKSEPEDIKVKEEAAEEESPWDTAGQLVAFRATASVLADDFLKSRGTKLRKGRKRAALTFKDDNAKRSYSQGKEDAKKIDVKRRRITETEQDVVR